MEILDENVAKAFGKGLAECYGGKAKKFVIVRGGVTFKGYDLNRSDLSYHDEYAAGRTGGGQEVVVIDGKKFIRSYNGGIVNNLDKLGYKEEDVIAFLKSVLNKAEDKTRFSEPYIYTGPDQKIYQYDIDDITPEIPLISSHEIIFFQNTKVFEHRFLICPIS